VGTDFGPATHDGSFHAFDKIRPATVVIQAGGSVTFEVYPLQQPAVYAPGTGPEDIDTEDTEEIPVLPVLTRITDATNRIALGPDQSFTEAEWTTPPGTFDELGRYLVICDTTVHFVEANMYAWVIVK
jgi:plastocyanin